MTTPTLYPIIVTITDDDVYLATSPDVATAHAHGKTLSETLEHMTDAMRHCHRVHIELRIPFPPPSPLVEGQHYVWVAV